MAVRRGEVAFLRGKRVLPRDVFNRRIDRSIDSPCAVAGSLEDLLFIPMHWTIMRNRAIAFLLTTVGSAFTLLSAEPGRFETIFFVATNGTDAASGRVAEPRAGTKDGPLQSVGGALREAQKFKQAKPDEPIVIEIAQGRYELSETIRLTPADSGLTIRANPGSAPILSGGRRILGWRRDPVRPGLWNVTLDDVRAGKWYFHQLFVDGERAQRARTPNNGYLRATGPLGTGATIELPFKPGDMKAEWSTHPDVQLKILMKWTDLHVPILAVDASKNVARLAGGPRAAWMDETDARYWVENTPDALDSPGEWYLERRTGQLSYWAPDGVDPNQITIVAPRLREIVRVEGDSVSGEPVRGVRIVGLTLTDTDYVLSPQGLISPQAAVPIRGCFRATHAVEGRLEHCTIQNHGGYAIDLGRGTQFWHITGNAVHNIGGGGIRIGEPEDLNPRPFDACHSHDVTDNVLAELGRVFAPACGVILFQSGSNHIAHNHIRDLFYTGISVGWNWGYAETPCRANVIEFNRVEQIGQKRLSDMGGIYTLGPQPGTVIRNNLFRDVESYQYGGWALYTDEGSTGILIENNVGYRCSDAGFHQHYGRDNLIRNNLLAWNQRHSVMRTRTEPHRSFTFSQNVIIADSGTLLGGNWEGTPNSFLSDSNVWFDVRLSTNTTTVPFASQSWSEWQARGQDAHSIIADPLLIDSKRPELGLKPDSPAFALGFKQIDLSALGPRYPAGVIRHLGPRRVLYNFDGDSCLTTKADSKAPVAVNRDDVKQLIAEVAYDGSRVDTVLVCVNAQVMYYPTKVGTMRGTLSTPEERTKWPASEQQRFRNLQAFFESGVDPYAVMLAEAKRRGREALLTFRMNDDHGNDFLRTQFLVDHPEWRLGSEPYRGKGAMDFGREEVRDYTYRLIEEAVRRYDCDGIELDFNRFPMFFKDGSTEERVAKMNSLVKRVRTMLNNVSRERDHRLVLAVRVPSNYGRTPPTPETVRQLGCDVPAWVRFGWVDFVAVSEFLFERGDLPITAWKQAITTVPVYGGIECTKGGGQKNLTADEYRRAGKELIKNSSDGVYLFNFFTSRELGEKAYEPPFEVLRDLAHIAPVLNIGSRLEPFVDRHLIDRLEGTTLTLHAPVKVPRPKNPLVGVYATVIKDGDLYRAVYRGTDPLYRGGDYDGNPGETTCYAESTDGHEWTFPKLALQEVSGTRANNSILRESPFCHNFSPFLDSRPDVPANQRFKAIAGLYDSAVRAVQKATPGAAEGIKGGLYTFASPDCIHWQRVSNEPVLPLTEFGLDSQNVAFWSPVEKLYVCCLRTWKNGLRSISRATSTDFVAWSKPIAFVQNLPDEHLYTSQTHPYFRAPHVLIALPTRYMESRGSSTEILFMSARSLDRYERPFAEAFIRPGLDPARWGNRANYAALNVVPTSSEEMSIYHVGSGDRYVLRTDGFASVHAGADRGEMVTTPFRFDGQQLVLNAGTAASGEVRCEIQSMHGTPIAGFSLADCEPFVGDKIEHPVQWKAWRRPGRDPNLGALAGVPVRLRFVLRDADLYAIQFRLDPSAVARQAH